MYVRKLATYLLVTTAGLFAAATAMAQGSMVGTEHDFSAAAWNASGETCIVCHTPHNGDANVASDAPLWNHELNATQTYTMYSRPLDGGTPGQPNALSKLCLSCHDGTIAVDSFGGATGSNLMGSLNPNADFGTNLANDHPISMSYTTASAAADGGLKDPAVATVTLPDATTPTIQAGLLDGGSVVECSSCHDVHAENTAPDFLLKVSNTASGLCRSCHTK